MNFSEFLTKKKIDLVLFERSEPVLCAEFRGDFEQMGEKSFDHSKKFWFNKLRRAYRLQEAPKPPKIVIEKTELASQAEPLHSPTIVQKAAFVPRFKAPVQQELEPETADEQAGKAEMLPEPPETKAPAGFKPRFKPGITGAVPAPTPAEELPSAESAEEKSPGKPVEEMPVTKAPTGFKPRFKPGVTGTAPAPKPFEESPSVASAKEKSPEKPAEEKSVTKAPTGFKPRFKPGVTGAVPAPKPAEGLSSGGPGADSLPDTTAGEP